MRLTLIHDGQLPLPFSVSKSDRRPTPALLNELKHIKDTICNVLEKSNQVWTTAAQIINEGESPAEEVVHFKTATGFQAPRRPSSKFVPSKLTLFAADKQITIESIDLRPEYAETQSQIFKVLIRMGSQGMDFKVQGFQNEDIESEFMSRVQVGQDVRPRWLMPKDLDWHMYAGLGVMLEVDVDVIGFAVVSTETLSVKAIQIRSFDANSALINHLMESVQKVKEHEATQKFA